METLVKLNGMPEQIMNELLQKGYFKTKTEAFRAGILKLGMEYGMMKIPKELELELVALKLKQEQAEAKALGLKYETHEEVKKRYGFK